jgi:hypothetical protein
MQDGGRKALAHKSFGLRLNVNKKFYWVVGFGDSLRGEKGERAKI